MEGRRGGQRKPGGPGGPPRNQQGRPGPEGSGSQGQQHRQGGQWAPRGRGSQHTGRPDQSGPSRHQQGGPGQEGSGSQGGQWAPRGRGSQHTGRPDQSGPSRHQQGGPGQEGSGSQGQQHRQGGQWAPRGRGSQHTGGRPDQSGHSGYQGQQHQGGRGHPRGHQHGQSFRQGPRDEQGPGPQGQRQYQDRQYRDDRSRDQGFQPSQRPQESFERSSAPAWEIKPEPRSQEPAFQQPAPAQLSTTVPAQAPPAEAISQPTPAEVKPGGKKKKGKGQDGQKPAPPATPSTSASEIGDVVKKSEKMALQTFDLPKRKEHTVTHGGNHVMKIITIAVNYLPLNIKNTKLKVYHYDVAFKPETPKYLLRSALEEVRKRHFSNRYPAFDGKKNMYVAGNPLNRPTIRDTVTVPNHETGRDKEFDVTIKLVNDNLNLAQIFEYCQRGVTSNIPQTEIQAMDIALRSGLTNHFTPAGRSFFTRPQRPDILGGGMELWHGFYQSAIPAWKPYLNIDVANKAFPIEQRVLDFMCEEFQCNENSFQRGLEAYQKERLREFLTGLKVSYEMPTPGGPVQRRIYKVTGLGDTPIRATFIPGDNAPRTSVGQYYRDVKNYNIRYPELPLLVLGTQGALVPIELCKIIGNQAVMRKLDERQTANMVRAAARPTYERREKIDNCIRQANFARNPTLQEFGIEVQTTFETVDAVVMKAPSIAYKKKLTDVRDGVWRLDKDNFLFPSEIPPWAVFNLNPRTPQNKISELERLMGNVGSELGMRVPRPQQSYTIDQRARPNERDIENDLREFSKLGVKFVIVILPNRNETYGQVKRASEWRTGVLTQCIKARTMDRINSMTVTNILLKVNAKLSGVNHCIAPTFKPKILAEPFMLVGADVTHPSPGAGAERIPSIAAVAASNDDYGFQYKMVYRLQPSREEMIIDLANVMKEQLEFYIKKNGHEPQKIIYYRDGVSEGQFQQVLVAELLAIRRACSMIRPSYEPPITFLVVQKRHHTRFFPRPQDGDRKNCNVPAGTIVDKKITHPTEVDFYLVSHQSIQGTARPTKYHLLWDDSDIDQVELEKMTYYLCHMFSRCTRSVSYPAPTYYAHLGAFRARNWWNSLSPNMSQLAQEQEKIGKISDNILNNHPMFFT
ncbi:hypothetical protein V9T40_003256 [Parthenolecanium corni]|uniref:Uncharacterized protein n=1 Tax=Parthenolecanium corni TaxID=536013 RepID=A0AAN9YA00_9HEMI